MTEEEFTKGWNLLTAQPWGKPYREGPVAQTQAALYWKQLHQTEAEVWAAVSEWAATGDHWPFLSELKNSIRLTTHTKPEQILARNATLQWADAPEPLRYVFDYQAQQHTTIKEAALAVLPAWLRNNPAHVDFQDAEQFLKKARRNFGVRSEQRGNVRCIP